MYMRIQLETKVKVHCGVVVRRGVEECPAHANPLRPLLSPLPSPSFSVNRFVIILYNFNFLINFNIITIMMIMMMMMIQSSFRGTNNEHWNELSWPGVHSK